MILRLSMRCRLLTLVALVLLGLGWPLNAQAPAQQPSPEAILLAKRIIGLKGVDKLFDPLVRGVVKKVTDQFMQTNFMWANDLNQVSAQLQKQYAPRAAELIDASARIYASHFTEPELKQILAFYQSPVGRRVITEEPAALDESMARAGSWGDNLSEEVIAKMRAEMKKRGHDL